MIVFNFLLAYFGNNFKIFILSTSAISCPIMIYILPCFLLIGMQLKEGYTDFKNWYFVLTVAFGIGGIIEMILFIGYTIYVSLGPNVY